ncbi:F-box/kelch-repeat protein At3g06240-like isoform X1 [Glycine soja]|uniref:F-box/kelch-repeat protein At3g06240-like isoform X1 n=1 Tax=Glycine soja TaxID=3848 RepID=UPI00103B8323|nr:F-box/kelch-repeat protein At3g06240-like isoform X1 [Glycine soja]
MIRNATLAAAIFPGELIGAILLWLPVRSVLRFKCVCKSWLSVISDPHFAKSHFELAIAPTHRVLKLLNNFQVNSIDVDNDDDSADILFNTPLLPPPHAAPKYVYIAGSCRGFILLELVSDLNSIHLVVWNPSTGLVKRIHHVNHLNLFDIDSHLCGIGYDSSTDDYVVVTMACQRPGRVVNCLSLRTNSWSFTEKKQLTAAYDDNEVGHVTREFLNGAFHWLEYCKGLGCQIIVAFDVREKELSEVPRPRDLPVESEDNFIYDLISMGECLCLCFVRCQNRTRVYEMWTMKEYKVQASWTRSFVFSTSYYSYLCSISPLCFTKNEEILGLKENKLVRINGKGEVFEHRPRDNFAGRPRLHVIYTGSLLSLPRTTLKN